MISSPKRSAAISRKKPAAPPAPSPADEYLKLDNQLCFPLYAASRLVVQSYGPLLAQLGITYPQYLVMMILWEKDGATVRELGERLYLDSGTLTPVLQRMVQAGLVRRERRARDERTVENWLTPRGRALKKRAARVPEELFCQLGMELGDFARLRTSLHELLVRLQKMAAQPSPLRL